MLNYGAKMAMLISEALTDMNRMSTLLSPSSKNPNVDGDRLISLINSVSQFLLTFTHRPSFKYYSVSGELHDGNGIEFIQLNYWPIIALTSIYDDVNRTFGSESLIAATDYEIYRNNPNSPISNAGQVRYLDGTFAKGMSNVKVTYTAGFSLFEIHEGYNDQIIVAEGSGANVTVTLTAGRYHASSLATHIGTVITNDATLALTYTCSYSAISHRFKISTTSTFHVRWLATGFRHRELGRLLGFDVSADDVNASSYTADYPALGIPEDVIDVANSLVHWRYMEMVENRIGKFSEGREGTSYSFDYSNIPNRILRQLEPYILWSV